MSSVSISACQISPTDRRRDDIARVYAHPISAAFSPLPYPAIPIRIPIPLLPPASTRRYSRTQAGQTRHIGRRLRGIGSSKWHINGGATGEKSASTLSIIYES